MGGTGSKEAEEVCHTKEQLRAMRTSEGREV